MSESLFRVSTKAGVPLQGRVWTCAQPKRTLIGVHGYSEHSGCYRHVAEFLLGHGVSSYWIDLPGHGLSEGRRGNIDRFEDYLEAVDLLRSEAVRSSGSESFCLFGHSLGGLIALRCLQSTPAAIQSILLSGPLLGLHRFSESKLTILEWASWVLPNFTIQNDDELGESCLTHDPEAQARRRADPLINPVVTLHWFREFVRAKRLAFRDVSRVQIPIAVLAGSEESVVSLQAMERWVGLLEGSKKFFKVYEGMRHEILNEIGREKVLDDIRMWLFEETLTQSFVSK